MEGLARASGAPVKLTVKEGPYAGTYEVAGMTLEDYGKVEQHLLRRRKPPLEALEKIAEKVTNPRLLQMIARMAYNDVRKDDADYKIPAQDVYDFLDSVDGLMFTAWLCLKKNHPDMSEERARGIMNAVGAQEFKRLRDQASGTDERGNETGPTPEGTAGAGPNGFPGGESTATLPASSVGGPKPSTA